MSCETERKLNVPCDEMLLLDRGKTLRTFHNVCVLCVWGEGGGGLAYTQFSMATEKFIRAFILLQNVYNIYTVQGESK